jgi:hypothetical protein
LRAPLARGGNVVARVPQVSGNALGRLSQDLIARLRC